MSLMLVIRRVHLYLGMFLAPWVILFGLSSLPLNHASLQRPVRWTVRDERPYQRPIAPGADLRDVGREILADAGLAGGFNVSRPSPTRIVVNRPNFRRFARVTYDLAAGRLTIADRTAAWPQSLTAMHTRAGFYNRSPGNSFWAVLIDVLCVGLVVWIATGLTMWWQLRGSRTWGWVALGAGLASFTWLVLTL